jgi:hypothetical protein
MTADSPPNKIAGGPERKRGSAQLKNEERKGGRAQETSRPPLQKRESWEKRWRVFGFWT